jgi:hypothetical protein
MSQVDKPEPPEEINREPEWEVKRVLASRRCGETKKQQYQVSWKGCDPDDEWYPMHPTYQLKNSSSLLETFHKDYPNATGPPPRLDTAEKKHGGADRDLNS